MNKGEEVRYKEKQSMHVKVNHLTILVKDLDEALEFFVEKLHFIKTTDIHLQHHRWVAVKPHESCTFDFSLIVAAPSEEHVIGKQAGNNIFAVLETNNFQKTYNLYKKNGVKFVSEPISRFWGKEVNFVDICGNKWSLVQRNCKNV